ncbi:YbgA family protein [Anoxybacteroides amylolyticum]|uniref:DUF1722 domain-containing protein n=1 Tax=Anoxybacteroides amylolyticum TaxID=294699 RepID=A0A160F4Q5_9BACL|nr:DUF523 and DUF1722 domain-containing protein [Anoxybacillus amylolyticus]ANB61439.1 hypothetical protein GFC30_1216 [Anoxybacillus amylolyticus]
MPRFATPVVVVSECLGFAPCRYNGDQLEDETVRKLVPFVRFIPVCPEMQIGLGTPRETIRLVMTESGVRLVQPSTGIDWTEVMNGFSAAFLHKLRDVDGFILKSRSPSCGMKDVKIYRNEQKGPTAGKGSGLFAEQVLMMFPHKAIEEEGRLTNFSIREHFLTKLFTLALFREVKQTKSHHQLVEFHAEHKYLFMAYHQKKLKELGNTVANRERLPIDEVFSRYEQILCELFAKRSRRKANINVCQHMMGYFKHELSTEEKHYFEQLLSKYRDGKLPLSSVTSVIKSWAVRYKNEYLLKQRYFEPYPEELIDITDSGKGRDY